MPDIIGHLASGYLLRNLQLTRETLRHAFPLVLFGLILPDLLSRAPLIMGPRFFFTAQYFHTPFACFLQTLVFSTLFAPSHRRIAFRAITLGWVLHQSFDLLQGSLGPGFYYILWPLWDQPFQIGLFWAGNWPYVAGVTILLAWLSSKKVRLSTQKLINISKNKKIF